MVPFPPRHELHQRRFGRNLGVGVALLVLIGIVFALTVVKVTRGEPLQAFDHQIRPGLLPGEPNVEVTTP